MHYSSESVETLIEQLCKLPSIGRKSAQRLAAHVLKMPRGDVDQLARALIAVKDRVQRCTVCQNVTDTEVCLLCRSNRRDKGVVCVVGEPSDVVALERTGEYSGTYHVLGGVISPLDGVGPDDLYVRELLARLARNSESDKPEVREIILAVNPTVDGDITAHYLGELLRPYKVHVTRLARGLPVGSDLTFADEATLARALAGRAPMDGTSASD